MVSSAHTSKRSPLPATFSCPSSSPPAPAAAPAPSSSSPSPSPPSLFMCCVSLPGPLQPLSLPSPSSSSSSSSSADLPPPPPRHSFPTLSEIAHIEASKSTSLTIPQPQYSQRNHVAELLLFRSRRKPGLQHRRAPPQQSIKQQNKYAFFSSSSSSSRGPSHCDDVLDVPVHDGKRCNSKSEDSRNSWELLKSGEVSNLIKQGFMERTQRRHSPGRVSPLMQDTIAVSAETATLPALYTSIRKVTHGHHLHNVQASNPLSASSPPLDKPAKPNTLFSMMSRDAELRAKTKEAPVLVPSLQRSRSSGAVLDVGSIRNPLFNNAERSDVSLVLKGRDGEEMCLNLHSCILVEHSKYFASRLSEAWCIQPKPRVLSTPYVLVMEDCEDLEAYQETLYLLYCQDLQARLVKYNVPRVLGILKMMRNAPSLGY